MPSHQRAWSKSAIRSSACSSPTETRTRPGPMPAASSSSGDEAGVGRVGRAAHERLGAAERRRHLRQLHALHEAAAGLQAAGEVDGQDRAAERHLPLGQVVLRMRREARVAHARPRPGAAPRYSASRRAVSLWRSMRTGSVRMPRRPFVASKGDAQAPCSTRVGPDGVDQVALARHHAERGVVVAGDALRGRVQHEVDAERQRLLDDRRGEGGVDQRERALRWRPARPGR